MNEGKYVILLDGSAKVFGKEKIHAWFACDCPERDCEGRAISAGFFIQDKHGIRTFGESTTLGLKSRSEDSEIIRDILSNQKDS